MTQFLIAVAASAAIVAGMIWACVRVGALEDAARGQMIDPPHDWTDER